MKLNTLFSASVLGLAIATASTAMAEVSVTSFTAGQAATAASVNANFTAVADGVNANEAAIAALLARIETLEAEHETTTYQQRIAGSTYNLSWTYHAYFGQESSGNMTNYIRFLMGGGGSTITLNANGTVTELNASEEEHEGSTYLDVSGDINYNNSMQTNSDSWEDTSGTTTWSVNETTGVVTIVWEGVEEDSFQSSEDGSLFVRQGTVNEIKDDQRNVESHNVYFVRIPTQP
ncbi:MAG: hypothetical protein CMK89_18730 [Pseudomonadales bacterium]|nr:hypothetical protein [Pseudomonadales bacterium]RLU01690.1 MAG: hypothetical protein D9N11_11635 [Ketobacter sp.]